MQLSRIFFRISPLVVVTIKGNSMIPKLTNKQTVLVVKYWLEAPHKNDIVLISHPFTRNMLVKRLVKITNGKFWVEGDNKNESTDSRDFGWVDGKYIIGKVLVKNI